jgi:hypothetical protein
MARGAHIGHIPPAWHCPHECAPLQYFLLFCSDVRPNTLHGDGAHAPCVLYGAGHGAQVSFNLAHHSQLATIRVNKRSRKLTSASRSGQQKSRELSHHTRARQHSRLQPKQLPLVLLAHPQDPTHQRRRARARSGMFGDTTRSSAPLSIGTRRSPDTCRGWIISLTCSHGRVPGAKGAQRGVHHVQLNAGSACKMSLWHKLQCPSESSVRKENDNFTRRTHRAQGTWDIRPSGGAGVTA